MVSPKGTLVNRDSYVMRVCGMCYVRVDGLWPKDVSNYFTRRFIHHENPLFTWKVHCLHKLRI